MKKNIFTCTLFLLISLCGYSQNPSGLEDRTYWITVLTKIADPVLENMSKGELKKNMPVETISGALNPPNTRTTHLEALGRLLVGMAPWLELGPDETEEGRLRSKYIRLMLLSIDNGFNPESPDYLNFVVTRQPLVDAAFFCQGILRAPKQIWGNLSDKTRQNVLNALQQIRKIKPIESNWLLFSAMVEATLLELTGECNMEPVNYAIMRFKDWYKGDGWYGDGVDLHMDYYNSYVIHPMLLDVLEVMQKYAKGEDEFYQLEKKRFSRYAEQQERMISPDGAYPVIGRSIAYRFGTFHVLSQAALKDLLPVSVPSIPHDHWQDLHNRSRSGCRSPAGGYNPPAVLPVCSGKRRDSLPGAYPRSSPPGRGRSRSVLQTIPAGTGAGQNAAEPGIPGLSLLLHGHRSFRRCKLSI